MMSGKKGKRGRIVGNPFHAERRLTGEEVNFFQRFKRQYAGCQAIETLRGIITLQDGLPPKERHELSDKAYRKRLHQREVATV